jgi:uncharacterized membrane protein YvbJ
VQHCTNCGVPREAGANFCGSCGRPFASVSGGVAAVAVDDGPYGTEMVIAAALLAVFMPFIALITALVMRANERRPARRAFLKSWAIGSAAWMCTVWILALLFFAVTVHSMSRMP